jgi:hypothetical protein
MFLAIAIVALAIAGVLFWLWRRSGRTFVLVAAILWLAYALWEFAVQIFSPEANIRVDLLLFYPILLIAGVIGLGLGIGSGKRESRPGS